MIITIIKIKNKIRKNRLLHLELEFFQIFSYTWVVFVLVNHTYFTGSGSFNNLDEPGLLNNLSNDVMD